MPFDLRNWEVLINRNYRTIRHSLKDSSPYLVNGTEYEAARAGSRFLSHMAY
jgi:hypothetical protein